jgi:hypothetical protein
MVDRERFRTFLTLSQVDNLKNTHLKVSPGGGIGRRTGLKIRRETVRVRVPPWAPSTSINIFESKNEHTDTGL